MSDLDERECQICGCTEHAACLDHKTGGPCHWVADDLCSACAPTMAIVESQTMAKGLALGDALNEWKETSGNRQVTGDMEAFAAFIFSRGFDCCLAWSEAVDLMMETAQTRDVETQQLLLPGRDFPA